MKVLIAPMAAMAENGGPYLRAAALCRKLVECGHQAAFCAAEDINYRPINNIKNYPAPIPSLMGLPMFLGKGLLRAVQSLGIQQKKPIRSFEEVLHITGGLSKNYFAEDMTCIRRAISDFKPDIVYSEFRLSAIAAANLEKVKVASSYSFTSRRSFASSPMYSSWVRQFLTDHNLPYVESILDVFNWADMKVVPSSYELEPIDEANTVFTGPFNTPKRIANSPIKERNNIIADLGNGAISPRLAIRELTQAFKNSKYQVYIASEHLEPFTDGNIKVNRRYNFSDLMPHAAAFINHGGQNSIMAGLVFGTPQIIYPGNLFERQYNASSIVKLNAGVSLDATEFNSGIIRRIVNDFKFNESYSESSMEAGKKLLSLGGTDRVVKFLEDMLDDEVQSA